MLRRFAPLHDVGGVLLRWQSDSKLIIQSVAKNPEKNNRVDYGGGIRTFVLSTARKRGNTKGESNLE